MPTYKGQLELEDVGPEVPIVHLFDYTTTGDQQQNKSRYRKQLVALDSCIYVSRRNLAQVKAKQENKQAKRENEQAKRESEQAKSAKSDSKITDSNNKDEHQAADDKIASTKKGENEVVANGRGGESACNGEATTGEQKKGEVVSLLEEGQEFEGYVLKCPNGPYDYAMKIWDQGRAAPRDTHYPKEGEEVCGLVVDREGDYLTIACGPNIAFATRKSFLVAGVDPDDLSLPFARLRVSLTKAETRPKEVPAAAWEARPTQVVVPPYDIY